jgi:FdhE protein
MRQSIRIVWKEKGDVAKSAITNLFRRREPLPEDVTDALGRLGQLAETSPALREAAAIQGIILRTVYEQPRRAGQFSITKARAAEKLSAGVPLLRGEEPPLDIPVVEATILRLCQAIGKHVEDPNDASTIAAAIVQRDLAVATLVRQALDGETAAIREQAGELSLNGDLLSSLLRFSLFPMLTRLSAELAPLRDAAAWKQTYCPNCGGWPLLGEHRGLEQLRYLRCGLCGGDWQVDRLLCPFCGTREHADLGYLHVEGADHERAVTCEHCNGYLKVLASLAPLAPLDLVVQDLATLHLDMIALERGYATN